jgi:hypothetical protein
MESINGEKDEKGEKLFFSSSDAAGCFLRPLQGLQPG